MRQGLWLHTNTGSHISRKGHFRSYNVRASLGSYMASKNWFKVCVCMTVQLV